MNKTLAQQLKGFHVTQTIVEDFSNPRPLKEHFIPGNRYEVTQVSYPGNDGIGADFETLEKRIMAQLNEQDEKLMAKYYENYPVLKAARKELMGKS